MLSVWLFLGKNLTGELKPAKVLVRVCTPSRTTLRWRAIGCCWSSCGRTMAVRTLEQPCAPVRATIGAVDESLCSNRILLFLQPSFSFERRLVEVFEVGEEGFHPRLYGADWLRVQIDLSLPLCIGASLQSARTSAYSGISSTAYRNALLSAKPKRI